MKNTIFVLSLFLIPFTTQSVKAADVERGSSVRREATSINHQQQSGFIQKGTNCFNYLISLPNQYPRTFSFVSKTAGSMIGAFLVAGSGDFSNIIYPNRISTFVGNYAGNDYLVGGTICLIGAYQLYQAMFGKIDNRPVIAQVIDAMIPAKISFFQDKNGRWRDSSGRFVKKSIAEAQ